MLDRNGFSACVWGAAGFGVALLLAGSASPASAQGLTIDNDRTTPVSTTEAGTGDLTVTGAGSVTINDDAPVLTINSDTDVSVAQNGELVNEAASDATGIFFDLSASRAANLDFQGNLFVGELDVTLPIGANNAGIRIGQPGQAGVLTGDITFANTAFVVVAGDDSVGVELNNRMVGNLVLDGAMTITGQGAVGVVTRNIINGEFTLKGTVVARGTGSPSGTDFDDISGSAVKIGASIIYDHDSDAGTASIGGIFVSGPADIGDTTFGAQVRSVGGLPAVYISPSIMGADAADIEFGLFSSLAEDDPLNGLYSFVNRGTVQGDGVEPGVDTEGMRIEGYDDGVNFHQVTFNGGIHNAGTISGVASSFNTQATDEPEAASNATGLIIGNGATIPELVNDGSVSGVTSGPKGGTATALLIEAGGDLEHIENLVSISARSLTTDGTIDNVVAYGIRDRAGSLKSIDNSGTIEAVTTDTEPGSTGIAIDLSENANAVTIDNVNETDALLLSTIRGDVVFGSGAGNVLNIEGRQTSDEDVTTRALVAGSITVAGGEAAVNVYDGTLQTEDSTFTTLTAGRNAADIDFEAAELATVELILGRTPDVDPILSTTGAMTFHENSRITFSSFAFLGDGGDYSLLSAGGGIDFKDYDATVTFDAPFLYNHEFIRSASTLDLVLDRKSADELGLSGNLAAIYEPAVAAAADDDLFGRGLVFITDAAGVNESLNSLLPSVGIGARALTIAVTDTITGPIGQRQRDLLAAPEQGLRFWGQQFYEDMNGATTNLSPSYFGSGAGVSVGVDWGRMNTRYGLSYTYFSGQVTESLPRTTKSNIALNLASLYANWRSNNFFITPQVSIGYASYDNRRRVVAGPITRTAISDWSAYLTSAGITTGYVMSFGDIDIIPHVSVDGLYMTETGYVERFGGDAVNLALGDRETRSVRLFAGIAAQTEFMLDAGLMKPQIMAGWSHELIDDRHVIDASFEAMPGTDFAVVGPKADASRLIGGAGFSYIFDNWSAAFNYDAAHNSGSFSQSASLTMTSRF